MNPLIMNNMNNIQMNNQPNFMDNTALNIKNIIQPYENKIRELEEIIKQKDFEIIVLKQKLNNNNNFSNMNMMNFPIMNMNMMNPNDMSDAGGGKIIYVNIESNIKNMICFNNDKVSEFAERLILTYNYKPLRYSKTLEENGIFDGSTLVITDMIYNINFKLTTGYNKILSLGGNCPIKHAIKLYFDLLKGQNNYKFPINYENIKFVYNSCIINIDDENSLKSLFINNKNPTILANDSGAQLGGKSYSKY